MQAQVDRDFVPAGLTDTARELTGIFPQIDRIISTATLKRYFRVGAESLGLRLNIWKVGMCYIT